MDESQEKKRIVIKRGEYYIYVYLDPRKPGKYVYGEYSFLHEPIYVGKGKRKRAYYQEGRNRFLKSKLIKIGKPVILILQKHLSEEQAFHLEKELISSIGRYNLGKGSLCNLTNGGEGGSGRIYHTSEETKIKLSLSLKGYKRSEEFKKKISIARKGQRLSDEHRRKISEAALRRKQTEETKQKLSVISKRSWENIKSNRRCN